MLDWPHRPPADWQHGWQPVKPHGSPWMPNRPLHAKVASTYVVASGPQLLRAADGTIPASARRRPAAGRRSR